MRPCITRKTGYVLLTLVMMLGILGSFPLAAGAKIQSTDGNYELDVPDTFWTGNEEEWFRVVDKEDLVLYLSDLEQSNEVFSVRKDPYFDEKGRIFYSFYIKPVKPGKTRITVHLTDDNGVLREAGFDLQVKKYPKAIKSLKVGGKNVKVKANVKRGSKKNLDQRFKYYAACKKTNARIKMSLKKDWKISEVKGVYSIGSGDYYETRKISKSTITKGKKIAFSKKYDALDVFITMENRQGDRFEYHVELERP